MQKAPLLLRKSSESISIADIQSWIADWLLDGEFRGISNTTLAKNRIMTGNLVWFLNDREIFECKRRDLQHFLIYVRNGHEDTRGRWGNPQNKRPARPSTVATYFTVLQTLMEFIVREGGLEASLFQEKDRPECRTD